MFQFTSPELGVRSPEALLQAAAAQYGCDRAACVGLLEELLAVEHEHAWRLLRAAKLLLAAREPALARVALGRAASLGRRRHRWFEADLTHARGLLAAQERADRTAERHLRSAHAADPSYAVFAASLMEFLVSRRRLDEAHAFADRVEHRLTDREYFRAVRHGLHV
jgi:hypothetical protein